MKKLQITILHTTILFLLLVSCKKIKDDSLFLQETDNSEDVKKQNYSSRRLLSCGTNQQNAGLDQTICPIPGSVQLGFPPESGLTYQWSPSQGLSNPNISNPIASPLNTTTYTLTTSGTNYIANGDFELGNTQFTNDYIYFTTLFSCGLYFVGTDPSLYNRSSQSLEPENVWCSSPDHTPNGDKMLIVDGACCPLGSPPASVFWRQNVSVPSGTYNFSYWVLTLTRESALQLRINGQYVGAIFTPQLPVCQWVNVSIPITITSGTPQITLIELVNRSCLGLNDFAIDDIYLGCDIVTDDVRVEVCNPANITNSSYFAYGACSPTSLNLPNASIIPNNSNTFCTFGDCGGTSHLFSNYPNNNQWYIDDVLVPNFGAQELIDGGHYGVNKYQVKNTSFGAIQLSPPTYVTKWNQVAPILQTVGSYKKNYTRNYYIPIYQNAGNPNTNYSWAVPGCTVTNLTSNGDYVQITFPANVPTTGIIGTLTVSNSPCLNGSVPIRFEYNPNLP